MANNGVPQQSSMNLTPKRRKQVINDLIFKLHGAIDNLRSTEEQYSSAWITSGALRKFIESNVTIESITRQANNTLSYTVSVNSNAVIKVANLGKITKAAVRGGAKGAAMGAVGGGGTGAGVGALIGITGGPIGVAIGAGIGAGAGAAIGGVGGVLPGAGLGGYLAYKFGDKFDVQIITLKDHFNGTFVEDNQRITFSCQF